MTSESELLTLCGGPGVRQVARASNLRKDQPNFVDGKSPKNTGAPKESSKSNVNAGGQTTSNSGTSRGPPAAPQPVNAGGKTTSNSGTNSSRGTPAAPQPPPRRPRPAEQ
ncbi:hypothetical protein BDZ89DRAFT_1043780 [Hymenopellis radicata]|nr:hypothetical protein BDZ89DRAFT_1043780 [Hymenopellis radicata]